MRFFYGQAGIFRVIVVSYELIAGIADIAGIEAIEAIMAILAIAAISPKKPLQRPPGQRVLSGRSIE